MLLTAFLPQPYCFGRGDRGAVIRNISTPNIMTKNNKFNISSSKTTLYNAKDSCMRHGRKCEQETGFESFPKRKSS